MLSPYLMPFHVLICDTFVMPRDEKALFYGNRRMSVYFFSLR